MDFSDTKYNIVMGEYVECRMSFPYLKEVSVSIKLCVEIAAMHDQTVYSDSLYCYRFDLHFVLVSVHNKRVRYTSPSQT